jgi:hypothetical protein
MSYDRAKHLVEVDENILAVFIIGLDRQIQDLFIAKDANIDRTIIDTIKSTLDLRVQAKNDNPLGRHIWDVSEYDKIRVIRVYESNRLIVVLAKSHTSPGNTAETVLGYLHEEEYNEQQQQPPSLF